MARKVWNLARNLRKHNEKSSHRLKKNDFYSVAFMSGVSTARAGVYVSSAEGGQKEELYSLQLELQVFRIQPVSETESGFLQGQCVAAIF